MREEKHPGITDEIVEVKSHYRFADSEQPGVVKAINDTYSFLQESRKTGGAVTFSKVILHLARQLEVECRKTRKLGAWVRERRSTIDGLTEFEKDVGMVRMASRLCPSYEAIHDLVLQEGWTAEQAADLYSNRLEVLRHLSAFIQEDNWKMHLKEACETVLDTAEAERDGHSGVADLLKYGYVRTDQEKAADKGQEIKIKVTSYHVPPDPVIRFEQDADVSRETSEADEDEE